MTEASQYKGLRLLKKSRTEVPPRPVPDILDTFPNQHPGRDYQITFHCPEFTAICPVTGQPDFGEITIRYVPDKQCVESKSLKFYLFSFRNHPGFHEEVVNIILDALVDACAPRVAEVVGNFRPRGGISLEVQAKHP